MFPSHFAPSLLAQAYVSAQGGAEASLQETLAASMQAALASESWWLVFATAWLGGFLTSLTPCVYPLVPITVRYFGSLRGADGGNRSRVVAMAVTYVLGMTLLYAVLGTMFASFKWVFGSFMANPWVVGSIAVFCAAMGASMLGAFTIQLPSGLSTKLSQAGGQGFFGSFVMGLVSGLIAAPCTGPVLGVILMVIASTGEVLVGFWLMVAFGLGLGLPFLFLAIFSGALSRLPSGGMWMEIIKVVLATAMFVVAVYFLRFAWPGLVDALALVPGGTLVAVGLGGIGVALVVAFLRLGQTTAGNATKMASVFVLTVAFVALFFGAGGLEAGEAHSTTDGAPSITWLTSHDEALAQGRATKKPVMIDFTADWCQACKELDRHTYVAPDVRREAERFVNVQIDATTMDDPMTALFDRYSIVGLPAVIFVDSQGNTLETPRVTGFVPPARFASLMATVK